MSYSLRVLAVHHRLKVYHHYRRGVFRLHRMREDTRVKCHRWGAHRVVLPRLSAPPL
ncbi:hypothetical protein HMPREF0742_01951 [Rothia aeria F0184]|uniref:Uncharacterized protein n=1 Tax=Rothia aeria F0184 TaxID=888019 RepID=U7V1Y0_9MICC|nr:hypothetical protein HMPREF0742_01951 [Rothia aeria F0184]